MPSPLMQQLVADHRNFATFLDILESQADHLDEGERTDLEIVEAILGYLQRYGDQCHHLREDLLYARLREKDSLLIVDATRLADQHASLQRATRETLVIVRRAVDGDALDARPFAERLNRFVASYRMHFEAENETLFPAAREHLTPQDWMAIEMEARIMKGAERVLSIQERFLALRDYIHRIDRLTL